MKKKKTLILSLLLLLGSLSGSVFAQKNDLPQIPGFDVSEKNGVLILKERCHCFPKKVIGMEDNNDQSIQRGKDMGASVQYILPSPSLLDDEVDQEALVKIFNDSVQNTASYFKSHPELKGIYIVDYSLFPGYKKAFQFPVDENSPKELTELNKNIKKETQCNHDKFCSAFGVIGFKYIPENPEHTLDDKDFVNYLNKHHDKKLSVYTKNTTNFKRVDIWMFMGTNGYLMSEQFVSDYMKNQFKNIKLQKEEM